MDYSTTRARGPGRGRTGGSRRPPPGTGPAAQPGRPGTAQPTLGYGGRSGYGGETSYPRRIQRQSPAPGRPLLPSGPDRRPGRGWIRGAFSGGHGLPVGRPRDGTAASYPRHGLPVGHPRDGTRPRLPPGTGYPPATQGTGQPPATPGTGYPPATRGTGSGRGAGRRRREPAEGSQPGRSATQPAPPSAMPNGGPPSRENAWRRPERRPGQEIQGAPGNGSGRRGIAASRVTVERRRLPDRGSQWTRPGAGISARTRSTRPGVPAGPVLAVERACAPCGECGRAARAGGRVRPRDIRARVLPAGRERPVSRRYGHPDLGGTRRRPTGG